MSYDKAGFLRFLDRNRTTIALMFTLPLIGLLFWFMYSATVDTSRAKVVSKDQASESVAMPASSRDEAQPKAKPDVTVLLGLKKAAPAKLQEVPVVISKESAGQGGDTNRQPQRDEPYPDVK